MKWIFNVLKTRSLSKVASSSSIGTNTAYKCVKKSVSHYSSGTLSWLSTGLASPCLATIFKVTLLFSALRLFELMKNMRGGNLRSHSKKCVKNIKSELCRLRDKSRLEKG